MVMTVFYVSVYQPELIDRLLIRMDIFGLSNIAQREHERMEKIKALTIPYEEKQVLMNRTVFLKASQEMVKLALGEPKKVVEHIEQNHLRRIYYEYYLGEDKRPTILVFEDDKLTNAYKGSALDTISP